MKYIRNTGRYALAFPILYKGRELKVELDKRRVYVDTGNIATSGITPLEDDIFAVLFEDENFKKALTDKKFGLEIVEEKAVKTSTENKLDEVEAENKKLKKALQEAEKKANGTEAKALKDENTSLKAQLEALKKAKVDKEPEGF